MNGKGLLLCQEMNAIIFEDKMQDLGLDNPVDY
jgi:hypothetical protein